MKSKKDPKKNPAKIQVSRKKAQCPATQTKKQPRWVKEDVGKITDALSGE